MKLTVFANYGVLAHEKKTAFTTVPHEHASASEPFQVTLPDEVHPRRNEAGEVIVTLSGIPYLLSEVLTNAGNGPALRWYDGSAYRTIRLPFSE